MEKVSLGEFRRDPASAVRAASTEPVVVVDDDGRQVITVSGQSAEWTTVDELEAAWRAAERDHALVSCERDEARAERDDWRRRAETMLAANQAVNAQLERVSAELANVKAVQAAAVADLDSESANRVACEAENDRLEAEVARLREALKRISGMGDDPRAMVEIADAALAENERDAANG